LTGAVTTLPLHLVGEGLEVPCLDGATRPYLSLDQAASTGASLGVAARVNAFLPYYSSVHRGAGYASRFSTAAYEEARAAVLSFAGRSADDVAILCRNTTEAINHLAFRLALAPGDIVLTTVLEHHANLLPWGRYATCRFVECTADGRLELAALLAGLEASPRPKLLAITGASNVTGYLPPLEEAITAAHERGVPVLVDAAQLAPHRALPAAADYVVFSGHKLYAPFGAGALIGPRATFAVGDPFLAGGGAVELVDLDEVVWSAPPEREEAGSPNVLGAVALGAALDELAAIGFPAITAHDEALRSCLYRGLAAIEGVRLLGPPAEVAGLPVAAFVVEGLPHALIAARLSAEFGIGVRHGCFCAHPYLVRLLGLGEGELARFRERARRGDHREMPGAVRASAGASTTTADVERFLEALRTIVSSPHPTAYLLDEVTGDYWPEGFGRPDADLASVAGCGRV